MSADLFQFTEAELTSVESCPLCASSPGRHQLFAEHAAGATVMRYVLCTRCGLVFQSPRPTDEALQGYYRMSYSTRSHSRERDPKKDAWVQQSRAEHLAGVVGGLRPQVRRHLDVGSSSGELLRTFRDRFGSEGYGVEPGEAERGQAAAAGLQMAASLERLPRQAAGTFDLVTLSHLLEHLPDPVGTLRLIRQEWLAADGLVLVETPNLYSHPSFEPGHLVAFTRRTLCAALASAGLELVAFRRHGKPYSRLLPLFLLAIARPAPNPAEPALHTARPGWIRYRRWLGLLQLRSARSAARLLVGSRRLQPWSD